MWQAHTVPYGPSYIHHLFIFPFFCSACLPSGKKIHNLMPYSTSLPKLHSQMYSTFRQSEDLTC